MFQEAYQPQFFQLFVKCSSDGHDHREFSTIRGIQIKKEIVGMIDIVITIGPRVVIDATQTRQEKQGTTVIGRRVLNYLTAMFRIHGNRLKPLRQTFTHVLLKKSLSLDSVGIAAQY